MALRSQADSAVSPFSDNCRCKSTTLWLGWRESQATDLASPGDDLLMPTQPRVAAPAAVSGTSPKLRSIAAQAAPPTAAGHARPGDRPCGRRRGSRHLVADEPERAPGHRRPVRCRGVPRLQRSRRSECLHVSSASGGEAHARSGVVAGQGQTRTSSKFSWSIGESEVAGVGRGESRGARTVSAGGRTIRRREPGRRSHDRRACLTPDRCWSLLEASRRQESGDTAGAWDCYRAVLRMTTHFRRRGSTLQRRLDAKRSNRWLQRRLADWAADPRTTIPQLHTALEEVLKNEPKPDWDHLRLNLGISRSCARWSGRCRLLPSRRSRGNGRFGSATWRFRPTWSSHLEAARRFLLREPERSRRVLRLLCANYLAHVEARELPPRKPAVWAMFSYLDLNEPDHEGQDQRAALPRQSGGTGRGPRATTAGGGRLAGRDPRRQAATHVGI